jgi:isoleucyl-tRNA synthetase
LVITKNLGDKEYIEKYAELVKSELNLKEITFSTDETKFVQLTMKPNLRTLGKRLGKGLKDLVQHLEKASADPAQVVDLLDELDSRGEVEIMGNKFGADDFLIERGPKDDRLIATEKGVTVLLDTTLTDELVLEGLAREVVNRVQKLRKDSGFMVSDRILVEVAAQGKLVEAIELNQSYIAGEVLAKELNLVSESKAFKTAKYVENFEIDEYSCAIGVAVTT